MAVSRIIPLCFSVLVLTVSLGCSHDGGRSPGGPIDSPRVSVAGSGESPRSCPDDGISEDDSTRWLSAWGGTRTGGTAPADATVRNVMRVTAGGDAVRVRFFNLDPDNPIEIGVASIAIRDGDAGANLLQNTRVPLTFNCGEPGVTIPPATASLYSDPIAFPVAALDDVAVSLHILGSSNPGEFHTEWNNSFRAADGSGDKTDDDSGADFAISSTTVYAIRDIEVLTSEATGAMTLLGSSSLHGSSSTSDAHLRVGEQLAARIVHEIPVGQRKSIVHRAIGGDSLNAALNSRMEQDIWSTVGVDSVMVWVTNDLASRTADQVIADYMTLIDEAHSRQINVICPTWVPGAQSTAANVNGDRDALNDWIRNSGHCDAVVDWGRMVEEPVTGLTYAPAYFADGIHANNQGHTLWADSSPVRDWVALPAPGGN